MSGEDRARWERMGKAFETEVFHVYDNDRNGVVSAAISRLTARGGIAADFGCGTGRLLPALAPAFDRVFAVDGAESLLVQARQVGAPYHNVDYLCRDLSRRFKLPRKVDAAVCINTLLTVDVKKLRRMLAAMRANMKKGGELVIVVPAVESALLIERVFAEWHERARGRGAHDPESVAADGTTKAQVLRGEFILGGVLTKHFLREEFERLLPAAGFRCETTQKVEYPWTAAFEEPPRWLEGPFPWDWLVQARAA